MNLPIKAWMWCETEVIFHLSLGCTIYTLFSTLTGVSGGSCDSTYCFFIIGSSVSYHGYILNLEVLQPHICRSEKHSSISLEVVFIYKAQLASL